ESSESSGRSVSLYLSGVPSAALAHEVTLRQSASGTEPTFWSAGRGTAYLPTVLLTTWTPRFGVLLTREVVLVRDQVNRSVDVPLPFASSAAFVLRKYSVPPLARSYCAAVGDCAGQTVKPGLPFGSARLVSIWVTVTDSAPEASSDFDIA